ncbi:auxin-responsive protein IAA12-like [Lolium rigidum]|uniref:auxin-responsive protein IAA12-like n=1 Tax=Lolium rigidum TaxID=89674 RepID=UPI001F5D8078|nr:auxin-responsive protein IAA12-like [Lolium rigidum]
MEAAVGYVSGDADSLLMATELRLGLPGTDDQKPKTTFSPPATPRGKKRTADAFEDSAAAEEAHKEADDVEAAPPVAKAQVVGWPPVRSYRKSCFQAAAATKSKANKKAEDATSSNKTTPSAAAPAATSANGGSFVKVSMDGAPYLRKIDMRMYKGYRELREALEAMFVCFSGADTAASNPSEYAITYEDKDGDLMLVGDVPFDMFSGTCKKLRIIKRSEATGLGSK